QRQRAILKDRIDLDRELFPAVLRLALQHRPARDNTDLIALALRAGDLAVWPLHRQHRLEADLCTGKVFDGREQGFGKFGFWVVCHGESHKAAARHNAFAYRVTSSAPGGGEWATVPTIAYLLDRPGAVRIYMFLMGLGPMARDRRCLTQAPRFFYAPRPVGAHDDHMPSASPRSEDSALRPMICQDAMPRPHTAVPSPGCVACDIANPGRSECDQANSAPRHMRVIILAFPTLSVLADLSCRPRYFQPSLHRSFDYLQHGCPKAPIGQEPRHIVMGTSIAPLRMRHVSQRAASPGRKCCDQFLLAMALSLSSFIGLDSPFGGFLFSDVPNKPLITSLTNTVAPDLECAAIRRHHDKSVVDRLAAIVTASAMVGG